MFPVSKKVAINKKALHLVIPEQGYRYGHHNLREDEEVVDIGGEQSVEPGHLGEPFGQEVGAPGVERDANQPHKGVFHHDEMTLAMAVGKDPAVVDGTVHHATHHRTNQGGVEVEERKAFHQEHRHDKINQTSQLCRELRLKKGDQLVVPLSALACLLHPITHRTAIKRINA